MATDAVARMRCRIGEHELEGPTAFVAKQVDRWARLTGLATAPPTPLREARGSAPFSGGAMELGMPAKPADLFHFDQGKRLVVPRLLRRGRRRSAEAALLILYGYRIFVPEKPLTPGTLFKASLAACGIRSARLDKVVERHVEAGHIQRPGTRMQGLYALTFRGERSAAALMREFYLPKQDLADVAATSAS